MNFELQQRAQILQLTSELARPVKLRYTHPMGFNRARASKKIKFLTEEDYLQ